MPSAPNLPFAGLPACVIFNPMAGKRRAQRQLFELQRRYADQAEFWPTANPGHAVGLARQAADAGFAIVAAAGGDGTVHEVANGLLESSHPERPIFAVIPIGSANDYAYSLQQAQTAGPRWVDVGLIQAGNEKRYFVECLGLGFNAGVTAESRKIHRLKGHWLYGLATLHALRKRWRQLDLSVAIDDRPPIEQSALMLSVMIGNREGGFVLAPHARVDDGEFDVVLAGQLSRFGVLRLLAKLCFGTLPTNDPRILRHQGSKLTVLSRQPMSIHVDGELLCQETQAVTLAEITLLPKRLRVQLGL